MTVKTPPIEEAAERWVEGNQRAVREALEKPLTQKQYDWALAFQSMCLRRLWRVRGAGRVVSFTGAQLEQMGLVGVEKVIVLPLPEGGCIIRPATEEDAAAVHRMYASGPPPIFPRPEVSRKPQGGEKVCLRCGTAFVPTSRKQCVCNDCYAERRRARERACWHRTGKTRPSYQAKLKHPRATPSPPEPLPA